MTKQREIFGKINGTERFKCLIDGCSGVSQNRGLCTRCYEKAKTHIKRGRTTWEKLIELDLALASRREKPDAFRVAMKKAGIEK